MSSNSSNHFLAAVKGRRSIYTLSKDSPLPNDKILQIVTAALKYAPSPFNVRSCRCIVLFGDEHDKLWQHAYEITEKGAGGEQVIKILGPRIKGFEAAKGTVLFFDDSAAYNALTPRFAALSKQYPDWEEHSSGMHQFIVWTALETEGLGCNLQHYQPSITPYVNERFQVPESWTLKCELVFGGRVGDVPEEKPKTYLEESLKVFGA